jgi:DinB superfamily
MPVDTILREQIADGLDGGDAHQPFAAAVADFPAEAMNAFPPNVGYTPWHLLEHLRITQRDILDYIRDRDYVERRWPDDYWPPKDATATPADWARTVDGFMADLAALRALVLDRDVDLEATIPNTPGHTILREARIDGTHNSYHVGEFAILRQVMGTWPADRRD